MPDTALRTHAAQHGVVLADSHVAAARDAELVVSAVTASQAVAVARSCADGLARGAFFLDFNSASPGAKIEAAGIVDAAGGRYVEGAVMTSVPPYRIKVPLLLGGPHAAALEPSLIRLGFVAKVASERTRRGLGHQDVPQRDDQRAGGDGDRGLHHCAPLRRGRRGARFAEGNIPRHRLGEAGRVLLPARHRTRAPPQRGGARGGGHRARGRARAMERRLARPSARPGSRTWPIAACSDARGEGGFARSADWRVEADRILAQRKAKGAGR